MRLFDAATLSPQDERSVLRQASPGARGATRAPQGRPLRTSPGCRTARGPSALRLAALRRPRRRNPSALVTATNRLLVRGEKPLGALRGSVPTSATPARTPSAHPMVREYASTQPRPYRFLTTGGSRPIAAKTLGDRSGFAARHRAAGRIRGGSTEGPMACVERVAHNARAKRVYREAAMRLGASCSCAC